MLESWRINRLEPERNIFNERKTETLDGSSGEAGNSGDQGRSPRTFISFDTVLLGLREVMGSDRTAANQSLDLGHTAVVDISQSAFILGERKHAIHQQNSSAHSQGDLLSK